MASNLNGTCLHATNKEAESYDSESHLAFTKARNIHIGECWNIGRSIMEKRMVVYNRLCLVYCQL